MPHRVRLVLHRISIYTGAKRIPQVYIRLFRRNDWFRNSALGKFSVKANFSFVSKKFEFKSEDIVIRHFEFTAKNIS